MAQQITVHKSTKSSANSLWWQPFLAMQRQMNHAFQEPFSHFVPPSFFGPTILDVENDVLFKAQDNIHNAFSEIFNNRQIFTQLCSGQNGPYIDIIENGSKFKIRIEIPGLNAKDLDVTVADNSITIKGSKTEEAKEEGDEYIRQECCCSSFNRTIALPKEADLDKASFTFDKSILNILVPKKEARKSRKLEINAGEEEQASSNSEAVKIQLKPVGNAEQKPHTKEAAKQEDESSKFSFSPGTAKISKDKRTA